MGKKGQPNQSPFTRESFFYNRTGVADGRIDGRIYGDVMSKPRLNQVEVVGDDDEEEKEGKGRREDEEAERTIRGSPRQRQPRPSDDE